MENHFLNNSEALQYNFEKNQTCEMCGNSTLGHRVLGQRLNQTQGYSPRKKSGISVSVLKCTNCGLIYSQPMPIPFNMQDHYGIPPENYWKKEYFKYDPEYFAYQIKVVKEKLPFKPGMSALDVGAGIGKCMISLQKSGFDTFGFEPSKPFYEKAISMMGIDESRLKFGMIETVNYDAGSFDFITFGAVFEHLYHPAKCLEKALGWLKPGGIIQIEVPSSNYLIAKLYNIYFRLRGTNYVSNISPMHTPFHLYEFDLKSFEELAKRLPFTIEHSYYHGAGIRFIPKFLHPLLSNYMKWTNSYMQLTVYLKK